MHIRRIHIDEEDCKLSGEEVLCIDFLFRTNSGDLLKNLYTLPQNRSFCIKVLSDGQPLNISLLVDQLVRFLQHPSYCRVNSQSVVFLDLEWYVVVDILRQELAANGFESTCLVKVSSTDNSSRVVTSTFSEELNSEWWQAEEDSVAKVVMHDSLVCCFTEKDTITVMKRLDELIRKHSGLTKVSRIAHKLSTELKEVSDQLTYSQAQLKVIDTSLNLQKDEYYRDLQWYKDENTKIVSYYEGRINHLPNWYLKVGKLFKLFRRR